MSIWTTAPQVSRVPTLPPNTQVDQSIVNMYTYIKEMANVMTSMKNDLEFMINGHLDANNIRANSIETKNLKAGAVTADKIDVDELSAITANMGKLTSGQIFGAYIATLEAAFPRCELDSATNRIRSAYTDTDYISLEPGFGGSPSLYMTTDLNDTSLSSDGDAARLQTVRDLIIESSTGDIRFNLDFGIASFGSFYEIYDRSTGETLQQKLDDLSSGIGGLASAISSLDARVTALETP